MRLVARLAVLEAVRRTIDAPLVGLLPWDAAPPSEAAMDDSQAIWLSEKAPTADLWAQEVRRRHPNLFK